MPSLARTKHRPHAGAGVPWRKRTPKAGGRSYVYGSYVDEPLALITPTAKYCYHANHLYSVAALTDAAGSVVERYRYDTYGNRTVLAADGVTTRAASSYNQQVGFTGRVHDRETGLGFFRTRYVSFSLGKFLNRSPWGASTGFIDGNYSILAVDPFYIPVFAQAFRTKMGGYVQSRYSLYDYMKCDPANNLEAFSLNPGTAIGAGAGSALPGVGTVIGGIVGTIVFWWVAAEVINACPPFAPPLNDPWYKDPNAPKDPFQQPKPTPKTDPVPPMDPPKNPPKNPKDPNDDSGKICIFECSCCPPKMMTMMQGSFKGDCPYSMEFTCPGGKMIDCYLKGAKR